MPDNVYAPTRRFCDETLSTFGVETLYYDPLIGEQPRLFHLVGYALVLAGVVTASRQGSASA